MIVGVTSRLLVGEVLRDMTAGEVGRRRGETRMMAGRQRRLSREALLEVDV